MYGPAFHSETACSDNSDAPPMNEGSDAYLLNVHAEGHIQIKNNRLCHGRLRPVKPKRRM